MTSSAVDQPIRRGRVFAWGLWNWGADAYNIVILTFVFSVYIVSSYFVDPAIVAAYNNAGGASGSGPAIDAYNSAIAGLTAQLSWTITIAGILMALVAPLVGRAADRGGHRKMWLGIYTGLMILSCATLFFVQGQPSFFWFGVIMLAVGGVFYELASVNYNAMLTQISTRKNIGRVSGFGWGMGYLGGIVLLILALVGFIFGDGPYWFGVTSDDGMNIRMIAVLVTIWCIIFTIPVLFSVEENRALAPGSRAGFIEAYRAIGRSIRDLFNNDRRTFNFLLASMIFRDGLAAVFTFGGILAATVFGFSKTEVILFAIGANVVAGIGVFLGGLFDDIIGPKRVIVVALSVISLVGLGLFFFHDGGQIVFWVGGLLLGFCVGPAQSASRSLMARLAPAGKEGEIFGLYAFTGRATVYIGTALFGLFVAISGATYWGILGIILVVLAGLIMLLPIKVDRINHEV